MEVSPEANAVLSKLRKPKTANEAAELIWLAAAYAASNSAPVSAARLEEGLETGHPARIVEINIRGGTDLLGTAPTSGSNMLMLDVTLVREAADATDTKRERPMVLKFLNLRDTENDESQRPFLERLFLGIAKMNEMSWLTCEAKFYRHHVNDMRQGGVPIPECPIVWTNTPRSDCWCGPTCGFICVATQPRWESCLLMQ
jgi:hypothetical protein